MTKLSVAPFCLALLVVFSVACNPRMAATATAAAPQPATTSDSSKPDEPGPMSKEGAIVEPDLALTRSKARQRQFAAQEKAASTAEVFKLSTTPCYGTCPVFSLSLMKDGTVYYTGINNVDLLGNFRAQMTADRVDRLLREAIAAGVFQWADTYPVNPDHFIVDKSNTITKVVWGGREKKITNNSDAPEDLIELEEKLIELVAQLKWEPVD